MPRIPNCSVSVDEGGAEIATYTVKLHHYDTLRDMLDRGERGWVELEHVCGDGRLVIRLEAIRTVFLATPAYCEAADARDEADALEARLRGDDT